MSIYTSEKVVPYVYMCIHKTTGQFYFGSRTTRNQKQPSHLDFPSYKTSSKIVKPNFEQYDWFIVAEFFDALSAYQFEQQLIFENWGNPLKLNSRHTHNGGAWCVTGRYRSPEYRQKLANNRRGSIMSEASKQRIAEAVRNRPADSAATRAKKSLNRKGRPLSEESKRKIRETKRSRIYEPRVMSDENRQKASERMKGKKLTEETRRKMSEAKKGRIVSEAERLQTSKRMKDLWKHRKENRQ